MRQVNYSTSDNNIPSRKGHLVPAGCDPVRRLVAAVAVQAITDIIRPPANLPEYHHQTARDFLHRNQDLYLMLGIPYNKLATLLGAGATPPFGGPGGTK